MGWFSRWRSSRRFSGELRDADRLPNAQKVELASEMRELIRKCESIKQGPNSYEELMKLFQSHCEERQKLAYSGMSTGPDFKWLRHAIPESYLVAHLAADLTDRQKLSEVAHRDLVKWARSAAPGLGDSYTSGKPSEQVSLDTHRSITITPAQAARGCEVRVKTETGTKISLSIPKNTRSGRKLRVTGEGKKMGGRAGDLYVRVDIR